MRIRRRLVVIILIFLTLAIGGAAIYIGVILQQQNTTPQQENAACSWNSKYICGSCNGISSSNPVYNVMVGAKQCTDGSADLSSCSDGSFYDACAPHVTNNGSCSGNYTDLGARIIRVSYGEVSHGAFVGCNASNPSQNCFCGAPNSSVARGGTFDSGNITCYDDAGSDSCGARASAGPTNTPTNNTPTPTAGCPAGYPVDCGNGFCCPAGNICYTFSNGNRQCAPAGSCPDGRAYCGVVGACCSATYTCENNTCVVVNTPTPSPTATVAQCPWTTTTIGIRKPGDTQWLGFGAFIAGSFGVSPLQFSTEDSLVVGVFHNVAESPSSGGWFYFPLNEYSYATDITSLTYVNANGGNQVSVSVGQTIPGSQLPVGGNGVIFQTAALGGIGPGWGCLGQVGLVVTQGQNTPTPSPSPSPSLSPTVTTTIVFTPTPSPSPSPSPTIACYQTGCDSAACAPGLQCQSNRCVNPAYPTSPNCLPLGQTPTPTLPPTALISDQGDRLLLAMIIILTGIVMLRLGMHEYIGEAFWKVGGKYIVRYFSLGFADELKREQGQKFEEKTTEGFLDKTKDHDT